MNKSNRHVPFVIAIVEITIGMFIIFYFAIWWAYLIGGWLIFLGLKALRTGLFASSKEIRELTDDEPKNEKTERSSIEGDTKKAKLIKKLIKERTESDPSLVVKGYHKSMVDSLSDLQLIGMPEATIVTVVETWAMLYNKGVLEDEIFKRIEAHRATLAGSGEMPSPLTLSNYIKYRIDLEHQHGVPISNDFIDYAIDAAKRAFL